MSDHNLTREFLIGRRRDIAAERATIRKRDEDLAAEEADIRNVCVQLKITLPTDTGPEGAQEMGSDDGAIEEAVNLDGTRLTMTEAILLIIQDAGPEGIGRKQILRELKNKYRLETKPTSLSNPLVRHIQAGYIRHDTDSHLYYVITKD